MAAPGEVVVRPAVLAPDGAAVTVGRAMREGAGRLRAASRTVWLFYVAATTAALLVTMMLMSVASASLGHSAWAVQMLGNFDPQWVAEVVAQHGEIAGMSIAYTVF